jgi:hypothetical protein
MLTARLILIFKLVLLFILSQQGFAATVEFSATAIQTFPQGQSKVAKMNVGNDGIRREYTHNQQTVIEIYRPSKGLQYLVLPQQKIYEVAQNQSVDTGLSKSRPKSTNPCTGMDGESCKFLGKEKINGRVADKWEVLRVVQGKALKALIWVDVNRGQALRQFFPDGSAVELLQTGSEKIGGRNTEKWMIHMTRPDGHSEKTFQWYDPEIGIIIKEVMPGGYIRELKDIKLGKQAEDIFQVPSDYKKVQSAMPAQ